MYFCLILVYGFEQWFIYRYGLWIYFFYFIFFHHEFLRNFSFIYTSIVKHTIPNLTHPNTNFFFVVVETHLIYNKHRTWLISNFSNNFFCCLNAIGKYLWCNDDLLILWNLIEVILLNRKICYKNLYNSRTWHFKLKL